MSRRLWLHFPMLIDAEICAIHEAIATSQKNRKGVGGFQAEKTVGGMGRGLRSWPVAEREEPTCGHLLRQLLAKHHGKHGFEPPSACLDWVLRSHPFALQRSHPLVANEPARCEAGRGGFQTTSFDASL